MENSISKLKQMKSRLLILILMIVTSNIYAQNLTEEQKNDILPRVQFLLKDYELINQFSSDGISLNDNYLKRFTLLFESPLKYGIYNDLSPAKKGAFSTVEQYVNFVKTNYQQGLDVTIDNVKIVDASITKNGYSIAVLARKKIAGIFNNQGIHRFNEDLYFILTSKVDGQGNPTQFMISGILTKDKFAQTYYKKNEGRINLGLVALVSQTNIYNNEISSSNIWKLTSGTVVYPGIDINFMLTKHFGIGAGLRLSSYNATYGISNYNKKSDRMMTDIDGDSYNPVLQIPSIEQQSFIKSYDIPVTLKFQFGKGKVRFYLDVGAIGSIISKSYFTIKGSSVKSGYYSSLNVTLTDIPEYGFGSYNYKNETNYELLKGKTTSFSGYTSLGFLFQISPSILFTVGAGMTYGLTDPNFDSNISENFINLTLPKPITGTTLRSTGVEMGVFYSIPSKH